MCKAINANKGLPSGVDSRGFTAFHIAALRGETKCIKRMLQSPALRRGGSHRTEKVLNQKSSEGRTALLLAAREGHTEIVRILLDKGAYVSYRDREGNAAIHYAALAQNDEIVDALLE